MPKTYYYDDVKILKKPLKKRLKNIAVFFLAIGVFVGVFLSSMYLSRALSVGNISQTIVFGSTDINIKKHSYFMVLLGRYKDYSEANEVALGSTVRGASGYIWQMNGENLVVGNIYSNKQDAEVVKKNISDSMYKADIVELKFPKIKLNFEDKQNIDVKKIREAIEGIDQIYLELYDNSIKFDSGDTNNYAVCTAISSMRGKLKSSIINIQSLMQNKQNEHLQEILNALTKIDELLDSSLLIIIDNSATNYTLKYTIASVVNIKYDLYNSLWADEFCHFLQNEFVMQSNNCDKLIICDILSAWKTKRKLRKVQVT